MFTRRDFIKRGSFVGLGVWGTGVPLLWQFIWPRPLFAEEYPYPLGSFIVKDAGELSRALSIADPGIHIVLEDGEYNGDFKVTRSGSSDHPVVIRARNPLKAKINGSLALNGDNAMVHSIVAEGSGDFAVKMGGSGNKVLRSSFPGSHGIAVEKDAKDWYIGRNALTGSSQGDAARQDGIIVYTDSGSGTEPGLIERNFFQSDGGDRSESHAVYVGQQKMDSRPTLDVTVRENLIGTSSQPYGKRRLIYVKHGCIIEGNTVYAQLGTCGIRHGERGKMVNNHLTGMHDIMLNGDGHQVIGNTWQDTHCDLMAETRSGSGANGGRGNLYQAADEAIVQGNSGALTVGKKLVHLDAPVRGVKISDHQGPVELQAQTGTSQGGGGLSSEHATQVAVLTEADVGPASTGASAPEDGVLIPDDPNWKVEEFGKGYITPDTMRQPEEGARKAPTVVRMHKAPTMPDFGLKVLSNS